MVYTIQYVDHTSLDELRVAYFDNESEANQFMFQDDGPVTIVSSELTSEPFYRVIVAGSRGFSSYSYLKKYLDYYLQYKKNVVIVSGHARGADLLGEKYAKEKGHFIDTYIADWRPAHLKGAEDKSAGHKRNADMAKNADACILFWDGSSKGTEGMLSLCKKHKLDHRVQIYKKVL